MILKPNINDKETDQLEYYKVEYTERDKSLNDHSYDKSLFGCRNFYPKNIKDPEYIKFINIKSSTSNISNYKPIIDFIDINWNIKITKYKDKENNIIDTSFGDNGILRIKTFKDFIIFIHKYINVSKGLQGDPGNRGNRGPQGFIGEFNNRFSTKLKNWHFSPQRFKTEYEYTHNNASTKAKDNYINESGKNPQPALNYNKLDDYGHCYSIFFK